MKKGSSSLFELLPFIAVDGRKIWDGHMTKNFIYKNNDRVIDNGAG